ncbi:MAG: AAA family ATPase [Candidatus Latescibacterota bacterium]
MIARAEVDGYRLLDGFAADLGPLTVVIGANAVGKSTLIDCLQLVAQCAEFPVNTALGVHWGAASVLTAGRDERKLAWRVTVRKPSASRWRQVPLDEACPLVYEVVLQAEPYGQVRPQHEVLRNAEPTPGHAEPDKYMEATPSGRMIRNKRGDLVPFDVAQPRPPQAREGDSAEPMRSGNGSPQATQQDAALLLSQMRFLNEFPVPSVLRILLANMAFYPGFDVTRSSALRTKPAEIRPVTTLAPNGENLGTRSRAVPHLQERRGLDRMPHRSTGILTPGLS